MHSKQLFVLFIFVFNSLIISAQQKTSITLTKVLEKVNKQNHALKISDQNYKIGKADYRQTNAFILPKISIAHTATTTTNPLMAFGSKLNQEILTQADFNPTLLNNPTEVKNFNTNITVLQPIFNANGFYMRKAAKAKMTALELQSTRTKAYITLEATKKYMQLQVAYKAVTVLKKANESALENKKVANNNFQQGYLQKADVLAVEIYTTDIENQLLAAKSNLKNISDELSLLMGEESNTLLKPANNLKAESTLKTYHTKISSSRADIEALYKRTLAYKNLHKANKMSYLPTLNAFGSYELHNSILFENKAKGHTIGAQLSWNLFDGYQRIGKTQKSKALLNKSEINLAQYQQKSQLHFNKAKRALKDAENKLKLTNLAVTQAKEVLRIRTNRFKEGLEKTADLLMAESQHLQKQLENLQTIFNYNFTKAYVGFLAK